MVILIGSRALAICCPRILLRQPRDFDFVCTQEEFDSWLDENRSRINVKKVYSEKDKMIVEGDSNCEFEIIKPNTSSELLQQLVLEDKETIKTSLGLIPNLDLLFTIKTSHRYLKNSPHVFKTLVDYHLMKRTGAKVRPEYQQFLKLRETETYSYKHPSLTNQTKESFFNEAHGVQYMYDHDSLHESMKHLEMPAYRYYAKNDDPIKSDKAKFFACPEQIRYYGAIEESSVLALERAIVPHKDLWTLETAWKFAFSKVITSITSGWFREWCYEHALETLKMYPKDYYEKFLRGLENGTIKKFNG